jgi:hypothetical protein
MHAVLGGWLLMISSIDHHAHATRNSAERAEEQTSRLKENSGVDLASMYN